jgi:hypothetical protein
MRFACLLTGLTVGVLPLAFTACGKKSVAPAPRLEGQWQADSARFAIYSPANVLRSTSTLRTNPGTTLTFDAGNCTDNGSLLQGTTPQAYAYSRSGSILTLAYPQSTRQRVVSINELAEQRLRLGFEQAAGSGSDVMRVEVYYSR